MVNSEQRQLSQTAPQQKVLIALCTVGTILLIGRLLKYSAYGIDFTDESFYLVWMSNPFIYDFSRSQFGFVYHPLYSLLGGNIAALRQANILITFGLAWSLAYFFLGSLASGIKESRITLFVVSAGFATSAFIFFDSWLSTPNYNSLTLQALLISATGVVLAEKAVHRTSVIGWVLIGIGAWLVFMAKPSTALALAVCEFACLLLAKKLSIRMILLAAISALTPLLVSTLLIDGSPWSFVNRLQRGLEFGQILTDKLSHILRIDEFQLDDKIKLGIFCVFATLVVAMWSMCAKSKKFSFIGLLLSVIFFVITALLTLGQIHRAAGFSQFQGLLIFGPICAAIFTALVFGRLKVLQEISAPQWAVAALFLVMPHIYAFGTANNYWHTGSQAAIFWLLAGLTLLGRLIRERASWLLALPLALATQAVTATLLQTGFEQPYRQHQPLRLNYTITEFGPEKSALCLSDGYAAYLNDATTTARNAGFESGTSIIDLTGQSPGILFALGAKSIGHPWTLGGYSGSLPFLKAGLSRFSCEDIVTAWVLVEPDGPRSISDVVMASLGAEFPSGYTQVGTWHTAKGAGGYEASRIQYLYKPINSQKALMACNSLRSKATSE